MNDVLPQLILLSCLIATLFMTGLIWFVQIVHYPLMDAVGRSEFSAYEQRHRVLTTWVVAPAMLVEVATSVLLLWFAPAGVPPWQIWTGIALLAVIWLSTALLQVPCHETLSRGFDDAVHRRLVSTNWIRTAAWSLRGLLVLWMLVAADGQPPRHARSDAAMAGDLSVREQGPRFARSLLESVR